MQISSDKQELGNCLPKTVKVDIETFIELAWNLLAIMSGGACVIVLMCVFLGNWERPPDPAFRPYLVPALLTFGFILLLRSLTNNYYIVDRERKAVFYHFECVIIRSIKEYLRFSDIDSIAVNGRVFFTKGSRWYEYRILLIDRTGKSHWFSESLKEPGLMTLNQRAETLSKIIDCRLFPGKAEHIHTISPGAAETVYVTTAHIPLDKAPHDLPREPSEHDLPGWVLKLVLIGGSALFIHFIWFLLH